MQQQINKKDFTGQNFYCGIDLHKKTWTVTMEADELYKKTISQSSDKQSLIRYIKNNYPGANVTAGYEAGYFGYGLYHYLQDNGISCSVLHPADIPTTQKEKDQKRDPIDSKKIARALRTGTAKTIWVPTLNLQQDRQLLRTRRTITKDVTRTKNRIKAFLQTYDIDYPDAFKKRGSHWSRKFIAWLEQIKLQEDSATISLQVMVRHLKFLRSELIIVLNQIRVLAKDNKYIDQYNKLINITGIGVITAMTIIMEIDDVRRFKNTDHFRSFIGFIPRSHSSGEKSYNGKITNRANHHLRSLLVEACWSAVGNDPYYYNLYSEYKKRMKGNKAIVRVAGKMANQIYFCLKKI
jgi:transposase